MANKNVLGLFSDAETAADATDVLKEKGVGDYDVLTGSPYPEGAFGEETPKHHVYVFPIVGALMGLTIAFLLTAGTQLAYPMVTGGKPILAFPAMLIISYEGTLLGAVLFSLITTLSIIIALGLYSHKQIKDRMHSYEPESII